MFGRSEPAHHSLFFLSSWSCEERFSAFLIPPSAPSLVSNHLKLLSKVNMRISDDFYKLLAPHCTHQKSKLVLNLARSNTESRLRGTCPTLFYPSLRKWPAVTLCYFSVIVLRTSNSFASLYERSLVGALGVLVLIRGDTTSVHHLIAGREK